MPAELTRLMPAETLKREKIYDRTVSSIIHYKAQQGTVTTEWAAVGKNFAGQGGNISRIVWWLSSTRIYLWDTVDMEPTRMMSSWLWTMSLQMQRGVEGR